MTPLAHKHATEILAEAWSEMESACNDAARRRAATLARRFLGRVYPRRRKTGPRTMPGRPVVCRTDPDVGYPSAIAATKALGLRSHTSLVSAINSGTRAGGLFWRYADTPEEKCPPMREPREKPVRWLGVKYPTIRAAALATMPEGGNLKCFEVYVGRKAKRERSSPPAGGTG